MPIVTPSETLTEVAKSWWRATAPRIFFIMMLALLPLAASTIISNWRSIRTAEQDKINLMASAAQQNAAQLSSDIKAIHTSMTMTANVLVSEPDPGNICNRLQNLFLSMAGSGGIELAIFNDEGRVSCLTSGGAQLINAANAGGISKSERITLAPALDGLLIRSASKNGELTTLALYRRTALERLASSKSTSDHQTLLLREGQEELAIAGPHPGAITGKGVSSASSAVEGSDLEVVMVVHDDARNTRFIALLMPLVLWLAAGLLGWLVVRWALIQPLMALRQEVASYEPGKIIVPPRLHRLASSEIVELGEAFREMSKDVAEHEGEMRETLDRQTRLTREVHHRVKNNLQIISSLISLHWRAAEDEKTGAAYLSIQRRVDALAVVQRNHYAELDEERGVRARPMMSEIASGLKTSAQIQSGRNLDISTNCDDIYLHQDVAAPLAFMTAELAELVIAVDGEQELAIALLRLPEQPGIARFSIASSALTAIGSRDSGKVELYERVLSGLARQLRTTLDHDAERGKYCVTVPVTA